MEDLLDGYHRPYDPAHPVVCLDETSRQLRSEVRPSLPATSGQPKRYDPEDLRGGVAHLFLVCEPLRGWREVRVSDRRTRIDWAACVKELVGRHSPTAKRIVLMVT